MAADISFADGILSVEGTDSRDIVQIEGSASGLGEVTIRDSNNYVLESSYFWGPNVDRINVVVHGGDDHVENNTDIRSYIYGGSGNDTLKGGLGNDRLYGDSGNDYIEGHDGHDYVSAGSGNDTVLGQNGNDTIYGGTGDDVLRGGAGNDFAAGWTGKDYLYGDDGDDTLKGGDQDDRLYGGNGNDYLRGQNGDDRLYGQAGNDTLKGEAGNDYLSGSSGNDNLYGGSGEDDLNGHSGDDGLFGGADPDTLNGGSGDDRFLVYNDQPGNTHDEVLEDLSWNDAKINFQDGKAKHFEFGNNDWAYLEAGEFSEAEIISVDAALADLHAVTGNTNLLKRANGAELIFERLGSQTKGNFAVGGVNSGDRITLVDATFADDQDWISQVVFHEVGHNWDNENDNWSGWKNISGWRTTVGREKDEFLRSGDGEWYYKDSAVFARDYGKRNPYEDFATYFAMTMANFSGGSFDGNNVGQDALKDEFMKNFIDDMQA